MKAYLLSYGFVVMVVTSDMRWNKKALPDPDSVLKTRAATGPGANRTKRIIFIRHGESLWNEAFNGSKRPDKFLYQVLKAFAGEILLLPAFDSVLLDSPLNDLGFSQAKALARSLKTYPKGRAEDRSPQLDADVASLRAESGAPSSVVCTSNLRRAAQTAVVALWDRLKPAEGDAAGDYQEAVKVLSCLQEVSRNVDTLSLTPKAQGVPLQGVDACLGLGASRAVDPSILFDATSNAGNKPVFGTGLMRLEAFCAWAFEQEEEVVICAGHSLWFKHFFNTYLPKHPADHDAKDCKMKNGGCVAFTLERAPAEGGSKGKAKFVYRADPDIAIVDGGFDNKKKLQKAEKAKKKKA
jgi:broad specificity phosphatase PhoE